jgi:hypothetical protein
MDTGSDRDKGSSIVIPPCLIETGKGLFCNGVFTYLRVGKPSPFFQAEPPVSFWQRKTPAGFDGGDLVSGGGSSRMGYSAGLLSNLGGFGAVARKIKFRK